MVRGSGGRDMGLVLMILALAATGVASARVKEAWTVGPAVALWGVNLVLVLLIPFGTLIAFGVAMFALTQARQLIHARIVSGAMDDDDAMIDTFD